MARPSWLPPSYPPGGNWVLARKRLKPHPVTTQLPGCLTDHRHPVTHPEVTGLPSHHPVTHPVTGQHHTQPEALAVRLNIMLRANDAPSFIPATDAASRLGVSVETMRLRCRQGTYRAERRPTPRGMAWFVDVSALPAQSVPEVAPVIVDDAPDVTPVSDGVVAALTAHIDDLRVQLAAQSDTIAQLREAHTAELARLIDTHARLREDHAREVATLRDVNRDQFVILERLSVPRLADSQSTAPRPWWRVW